MGESSHRLHAAAHIQAFFKDWSTSGRPLDLALSEYYRAHRSLGARDRRLIGDRVYTLVRWQSLFDYLDPSQSVSLRLRLLDKQPVEVWRETPSLPESARLGLSPFLWEKLKAEFGQAQAQELAAIFNEPAPIALRVNRLRCTREELLRRLQERFPVSLGSFASDSLLVTKRQPLFSLEEFRAGLFEVQDEGSQRVAAQVAARPGERVLDYCSGSGGKSLAIAPSMQGKGELYLHDVRPRALAEARKRLRRAGVQNAQILAPDHPQLKRLRGKMDWVLVDVPCSGTGTLRRNPDMKWKIDAPMVSRLVEQQREIAQKAAAYVKPGGRLVYATCSLLAEENLSQAIFLKEALGWEWEGEPFSLLPHSAGPDGFFTAVFRKAKIE
jgi:16S rRNA C967 or C1407 C5-methylase (RsmB/RsmF family)